MSSEYTYDETGQLWPSFVLTIVSIVTIALTFVLFKHKHNSATFSRIVVDYAPPFSDVTDTVRAKYRRQERRLWVEFFAVVGWSISALMVYLIYHNDAPGTSRAWNPYDVLGLPESASEKLIKSTYRTLTRLYHPDKAKPDPSKNETLEILNDRYVEISKAYQALTDEVSRNNYLQYGHPDGKQDFSMGIGLPKFIVSDGNGKYVVLCYFVLLGVVLPSLVGYWWYGAKSRTKEGVLRESANRLFREYDEDIDEAGVIGALSAGKEFEAVLPGDKALSGLDSIEKHITTTRASQVNGAHDGSLVKLNNVTTSGLSPSNLEKLQSLDRGLHRKVLALLWAYLGRVELGDTALEKAKFEVAPIANALTRAFAAISLAYGNAVPVLSSLHASQLLIQAMPPKSSALLQLPHINPAIAQAIEAGSTASISVQGLMDLPDAKRRRLIVGRDRLTEAQYQQALGVAKQLPFLRVAKAFFKVSGEKYIIPSSLVTLVVKGRIIPPGFGTAAPEIDEKDLNDVDAEEDEGDGLPAHKPKHPVGMNPDGDAIMVETKGDGPYLPPLAYAPYFGQDHSPRWRVFLTNSKQGNMIVPPFTFTAFDNPLFTPDGKTPTYAMQTFKAQFVAPPQAGHYTFVMHVVCDSYVGFDTTTEVTLVIDDASRAADMAAEDEISEPDEDSLAGIMNSARGAPTKKSKVADESDSDESATEEDYDTSDTNTDTEPEQP